MNAPARHRIGNRRFGISETVRIHGRTYVVRANLDPALPTRVMEVFVDSTKTGSDMDAIAADGAIALSILMQAGYPAAHLAQRLSRHDSGEPASIIGAMAQFAARIDAERGGSGA